MGRKPVKGIVNIMFRVPRGREKEYERKIYMMAEALEIDILGLTPKVMAGIMSSIEQMPINLRPKKKTSCIDEIIG